MFKVVVNRHPTWPPASNITIIQEFRKDHMHGSECKLHVNPKGVFLLLILRNLFLLAILRNLFLFQSFKTLGILVKELRNGRKRVPNNIVLAKNLLSKYYFSISLTFSSFSIRLLFVSPYLFINVTPTWVPLDLISLFKTSFSLSGEFIFSLCFLIYFFRSKMLETMNLNMFLWIKLLWMTNEQRG